MARTYIGMGDIASFMPNDDRIALFRNHDGNYQADKELEALAAANAAMEDVDFEGPDGQSASLVQKQTAWAHYLNHAHEARGTSVHEKHHQAMRDRGVEPFVTDGDKASRAKAQSGAAGGDHAYGEKTKAELLELAEKRGLLEDGHVKKSMTKDELVHQLQLADRRDRG